MNTQRLFFYINYCTDMSVDKEIKINNQKPWMTAEVWSLLKACSSASKTGDQEPYSVARMNLRRSIKQLMDYKPQVENHFSDNSL